ncbi:hypothetical protein CS0771_53890 [Catellatospora sp. IY07-71]|uniref:DUF6584 family protein n=1 Tax=Catellatospora sp. IY07-71 TaxID=2728827 RepID=UPI001BB32B2A|nr:DUF6584 family protein [Catellatospora sp. IY07-71]BCJ75845.1 hypothetical protein CS0771_53890 [Catellatospora sp. IY07-71]
MAKQQVLAKVEADLRRGHVHPAMQRLASLTAAYPDDLDLRARRAAVYRQVGNLVEAGRWGFLSEDAAAEEISAFEKAHPGAWRRLLLLKVNADPADELGPVAGARFARLVEQAEQEGPAPVAWTEVGPRPQFPGSWRDEMPCLVAAAVGLIVVGLAVFGLVSLIRWAL